MTQTVVQVDNTLLKELLSKMADLACPYTYPVQGFLRNIIEERIPYDTYVNKWPEFQAIVTKPKESHYKSIPMYRVGVFGDSKLVTDMLAQPGFIPPDVDARFACVPADTMEHFKNASKAMGREFELTVDVPRCYAEFKALPNLLKQYDRTMSEEFYIAPLRYPEDVDYAGKCWSYGHLRYGENVQETLRYLVKQRCPAYGTYTKKDNTLVSWVMTDIDLTFINAYTIPEYRGRGTHMWIMLRLLNSKECEKEPKYLFIPASNRKALRNAEFLQAKFHPRKIINFVIKAKEP